MLVEANSKPHDIVIYTDGSVTRDRSGWGFTVKQVEGLCTKTVEPTVTTSSVTMEVEAVTHAIQWLASQRDARITYDNENGISILEDILTDVMLYLLLCGDLNSRTADKFPDVWDDHHITYNHFDKDEIALSRCSEDKVLNSLANYY